MNSFISHFKFLFFVALGIFIVELSVRAYWPPNEAARSNFLTFNFPDDVNYDYAVVYEKIKYFQPKNPDIIQVGDSSGYMGIRSNVVEKFLPDDFIYANLSCCTTVGYDGQLGLVKYFLNNTNNVKAIVMYNSPVANFPRKTNRLGTDTKYFQLGTDIYKEYAGWRRAIALPSLQLREAAHNQLFYRFPYWLINVDLSTRRIMKHSSFRYMVDTLDKYGGYTPDPNSDNLTARIKLRENYYLNYPDIGPCKDIPKNQQLNVFNKEVLYLEKTYKAFAELARKHGVMLIVAYQVVPCSVRANWIKLTNKYIGNFQKEYPEVKFLFPLSEIWDPKLFTSPAHIEHKSTTRLSRRLGEALAPIFAGK